MATAHEAISEEGSELQAGPNQGADGSSSPCRPMRADALRNRNRILDAAEEIFASEGITVPIDTVAERAGVGVGTLYRHFPTKEALLEAIVVDRLGTLAEAARSYVEADDPGEALFSYLLRFALEASAKQDLFEALGSAGIDIKARCALDFDELMASIDRLRLRAVAAGAVRPDVAVDEMLGLALGACHAKSESPYDPAQIEKMVTIVCDGLRSSPGSSGA